MDFNQIKEYLDMIPDIEELKKEPDISALIKRYGLEVVEAKFDEINEKLHKKITTASDGAEIELLGISKYYFIEKIKDVLKLENGRVLKRVVNCLGIMKSDYVGNRIYSQNSVEEFAKLLSSYSNVQFDEEHGDKLSLESEVEKSMKELFGEREYLFVNNLKGGLFLLFDAVARGRKIVTGIYDNILIGGTGISEIAAKAGAEFKVVGYSNGISAENYLKEAAYDGEIALFTESFDMREFREKKRTGEIAGRLKEKFRTLYLSDVSYEGKSFEDKLGAGKSISEVMEEGYNIGIFDLSRFYELPDIAVICADKPIMKKIRESVFYEMLKPSYEEFLLFYSSLRQVYSCGKREESFIEKCMNSSVNAVSLKNEFFISRLREIAGEKLNYEIIKGKNFQFSDNIREEEKLETEMVSIKLTKKAASELEKELRTGEPVVLCWLNEENLIFNLQLVEESDIGYISEVAGEKIKKSKQNKKTVDKN